MPGNHQHTLLQQFGRFLVAGALTFTLTLWLTTSVFVTIPDAHRNGQVVHWLMKGLTTKPFGVWLDDFHHGYLPFFLAQRALVACYLMAAPLAWGCAFLYDIKILRKENIV